MRWNAKASFFFFSSCVWLAVSFSHFISPSSLVRVPFIKSPFPAANTTQEVTLHGPIFLLLTSCLVMSSRVQTALNTQFITVFRTPGSGWCRGPQPHPPVVCECVCVVIVLICMFCRLQNSIMWAGLPDTDLWRCCVPVWDRTAVMLSVFFLCCLNFSCHSFVLRVQGQYTAILH